MHHKLPIRQKAVRSAFFLLFPVSYLRPATVPWALPIFDALCTAHYWRSALKAGKYQTSYVSSQLP